MSGAPGPVIEVRHLWTQFGRVVVHRDLNIDVEPGDILALAGGSGSGKTTLLRQMLGLHAPTRGSVRVFGVDMQHAKPSHVQQLRKRCGVLFQHGALFSALTAFDNVAQPMRQLRVLPQDLIHDAVLLKLHMVGITPAEALKMPADLSGGMIKRVALARALALEPELLFLDEPTAGLDPALSESFVALIQALHRALRLTVVLVTHDVDTMLALATRVAVLADQHIVAAGAPEQVMATRHPFIEQFFCGARGRRARQKIDHDGK